MKRKILSLALALALCLSLSVPALADEGPGWTYVEGTNVLTLNGAQNQSVDLYAGEDDPEPTIVLTAGSKNTLEPIYLQTDIIDGRSTRPVTLTFKGTGELVIYSADPIYKESGVLSGGLKSLKLEDGLTITGGTKVGDNLPVTVEEYHVAGTNRVEFRCVAGGAPAAYIRIAPGGASTTTTGFTDVAAGSPYAEAIQWAVKQGITNGTSATTFSPSQTCTTGQIWTFLWRANGRPGVSNPYATTDTQKAMAWAEENRYISEGVKEHPEFLCTRVAAVNYLWKVAGSPAPSKTANFSDVENTSWLQPISWAVEQGITNGTSANAFSPSNTCTRGQIVTFLHRANS